MKEKERNKYHIQYKQKYKTIHKTPPPHIWIIIETNMIRFFKKVTYFQYFPIFYRTA